MLKRFFDIFLSLALIVIFLPLMVVVSLLISLTSKGPIIYWSDRVGRENKIFRMPKFRSMKVGVPQVATHLLTDSKNHLTKVGAFIRKTSLDELPQLYSVLKGDMSFVGPRPALFNQYDLIELRARKGVDTILPGITGWAQINGRDELSIEDKVRFDCEYFMKKGFYFDLKIMFLTVSNVLRSKGVKH